MNDDKRKSGANLGIYDRPPGPRLMAGDVIAAALSVIWVLICGGVFLASRQPGATVSFDTLTFVVTALAILLPIALIWVATLAARSVAMVREESLRLQAAVDQLRHGYHELEQARKMQVTPAASAARRTQPPPVPTSQPPRPAPAAGRQPSLLSEIESDAPELSAEDLVRALHFPETTEDRAGFRALRRAMQDPRLSRLVQASEDMLTLVSQDGVYMDDLSPDRARPEIWRRFAAGERGGEMTSLGGVHDRESLEKVAVKMRADPIYRDAAHHFLRTFDRTFAKLEPGLTDAEIAALTETRTFRAFMLVGRVAGTFD